MSHGKQPTVHHSLPKAVGVTAPLHSTASSSSLTAAQRSQQKEGHGGGHGGGHGSSHVATPSSPTAGLPTIDNEVDVAAILGTFTDRHSTALYTRQVASLNKLCRKQTAGLVRWSSPRDSAVDVCQCP